MYEAILSTLVDVLVPVVGAALLAALAYAVRYLRVQVDAVQVRVARDALLVALAEAEQVASRAVRATQQTFVDQVRAAREDGKLTPDEAREALNRAKDVFVTNISKESLRVLERAIGPVQQWLADLLESHVAQIKRTPAVKEGVVTLANPKS